MEKEICPFGLAFVSARNERNITQWHVAANAGYHVTNLCKIEKGLYQPGVNLALRLLSVLGVDTGAFFEQLWWSSQDVAPAPLRGSQPTTRVELRSFSVEGLRCPFGPLLLQARLATGMAQRHLVEILGYNLRNMGKVERGEQEPGVMTALYMVVASGADVRSFFSTLGAYSKSVQHR